MYMCTKGCLCMCAQKAANVCVCVCVCVCVRVQKAANECMHSLSRIGKPYILLSGRIKEICFAKFDEGTFHVKWFPKQNMHQKNKIVMTCVVINSVHAMCVMILEHNFLGIDRVFNVMGSADETNTRIYALGFFSRTRKSALNTRSMMMCFCTVTMDFLFS